MPKILARNESEASNIIMPRIRKAVEEVADKILDENYKDVRDLFYAQYQPKYYERSMDFLDAWDFDPIEQHGNTISAEFGFSPSMMTSIPEEFQHGSPVSGDIREYLADIIYDGVWGDLFGEGAWQRKSTAFDTLVNTLDKSKFDKWMKSAFNNNGLRVK